MRRGAAWMLLLRLTDRVLGVLGTIVLARLLLPGDFGLLAMAMSVIALIELVNAFGFDLALIQKGEVNRAHYDTVWTLNLLIGLCCAAAIALLAYPCAQFYHEPRLLSVMLILALAWAIQSFENVGIVDFRKNLDFTREFAFVGTKRLCTFLVTVAAALWFRNYWALVAGALAGRVVGVALSYAMHSYRPRLSLVARAQMLPFSIWLLASNLVQFVNSRSPHVVIGRQFGSSMLGLYTVGAEIALLPTTELQAPINRAMFPGYARMKQDVAALREGFLQVIATVTLAAAPACVGIALVAELMVRVVLGDKWLAAVPVIQILALSGGIYAVTTNNFTVYLALGKTRLPLLLAALELITLLPLVLLLSRRLGVSGVAWAELASALVAVATGTPLVLRVLDLRLRQYLAVLVRPLLAAAGMGVIVHQLLRAIPAYSSLAQLALAVGIGIVTYALLIGCLWFAAGRPNGVESFILRRLVRRTGTLGVANI